MKGVPYMQFYLQKGTFLSAAGPSAIFIISITGYFFFENQGKIVIKDVKRKYFAFSWRFVKPTKPHPTPQTVIKEGRS